MLEVKFYESADDALLKFAIIISRSNGKWVICKYKVTDFDRILSHNEQLQQEGMKEGFIIKGNIVYRRDGKISHCQE